MSSANADDEGEVPAPPPAGFAAVRVERVVVRDFRGIRECDLTLSPKLTVLVGRNNAGKSRLLRALSIALGAIAADRDDLTVAGPGSSSTDVVLAPAGASEDGSEAFDARVARRLGEVQTIGPRLSTRVCLGQPDGTWWPPAIPTPPSSRVRRPGSGG